MLGLLGKDIWDALNGRLRNNQAEIKNIIEGFSGVVKPQEMLLVLGKPGMITLVKDGFAEY